MVQSFLSPLAGSSVLGSPDHLNLPEFYSCRAGLGLPTAKGERDKHGYWLERPCVAMVTHNFVHRVHLWKGFRTFFRLRGGLPASVQVSLGSGLCPPGMKKPV